MSENDSPELSVAEIVTDDEVCLPVPANHLSPEAEAELDDAKKDLKVLREKAHTALDEALNMVEGSQHPRSVEVFANLLRSMTDIDAKLVDLQKTKHDMNVEKPQAEGKGGSNIQNQQNNAIFVGSSEELRKLLQGDA